MVDHSDLSLEQKLGPTIQVAICGARGAGKTSLRHCASGAEKFSEDIESSIGDDMVILLRSIGDRKCRILLWDMDSSIRDTFPFGGLLAAVIVACDITNRESFSQIQGFLSRLNARTYTAKKQFVLVLGCKADLEAKRAISAAAAKEMAEKLGFSYMECSAKTGEGVEAALTAVAAAVLDGRTNFSWPGRNNTGGPNSAGLKCIIS